MTTRNPTVQQLQEVAERLGITLPSLMIRLNSLDWEPGQKFPSDLVIQSTRDETAKEEALRRSSWRESAGVQER